MEQGREWLVTVWLKLSCVSDDAVTEAVSGSGGTNKMYFKLIFLYHFLPSALSQSWHGELTVGLQCSVCPS